MRNFAVGFLTAIVVIFVGTLAYIRLGMPEVRADIPPPDWESSLMNASVHTSIRREAPDMSNPVALSDENLTAGGKFYLDDCAGCHGTPGKAFAGKGPVLYPAIPELPVVGTDLSEAQIFWVVKHGIRRSGMFANGTFVTDEDVWRAAAYIKHMHSLPSTVQIAIGKLEEAKH